MGCGVQGWGSWVGVWENGGCGLRVEGSWRFGGLGIEVRVWGFGFRVSGFGFRVWLPVVGVLVVVEHDARPLPIPQVLSRGIFDLKAPPPS